MRRAAATRPRCLARNSWRAIPGARNSPTPPISLGRYLANGEGGGALFLAPRFTNYEAFDDFSLLLRAGLRGLVSPDLVVRARARFGARAHARPHPRATPRNSPTAASVAPQAYHPLHGSKSRRSPSPTIHIFRDSEDLLADGRGMETINFD